MRGLTATGRTPKFYRICTKLLSYLVYEKLLKLMIVSFHCVSGPEIRGLLRIQLLISLSQIPDILSKDQRTCRHLGLVRPTSTFHVVYFLLEVTANAGHDPSQLQYIPRYEQAYIFGYSSSYAAQKYWSSCINRDGEQC